MSSSNESAKEICNQVLQLDSTIRLAGVINKTGNMVVYELRKGLEPLLTDQEIQDNIQKTAQKMKAREGYESKLGDVVYSSTVYGKVKRAFIPLRHPELEYLALAFDTVADHVSIITKKIMPALRQRNLTAMAEA